MSATSSPTCASGSGPSTRSRIAAPCRARFVERAHQRMRGTDLVVAVGADDEQVPRVRVHDQVRPAAPSSPGPPTADRRGTRPAGARCVANAHTNSRRTRRSRICASPERQLRHRRLRADDQLDLRDEVDDELSVRPQRLLDALPPGRDAVRALGQDVEHDLAERLDDGEVGDVALVLLELPRDEDASLR